MAPLTSQLLSFCLPPVHVKAIEFCLFIRQNRSLCGKSGICKGVRRERHVYEGAKTQGVILKHLLGLPVPTDPHSTSSSSSNI